MITSIIKIQISTLLKELKRKDPSQREYIDLKCKGHTTNNLKKLLNKIGFFSFNTTNSGEYRVGVSQIVAYINCGGYKIHQDTKLTINKETYNVHHYGDKSDNSPSNLVYLSVDDHKIVTEIQNGYLDVNAWCPEETVNIKTQFNRQGRPIKNHTAFIKTVIAKTIISTQRFLEKVATGKTKVKSMKTVQEWVAKIIGTIGSYSRLFWIAESLKPRTLTTEQITIGKETGTDILKTLIGISALKRTEPTLIPLTILEEDCDLPF